MLPLRFRSLLMQADFGETKSIRALIAAGAKFIGSHLCEKLPRQGREVLCVDNFIKGRRANISKLREYRSFDILRHDVKFPLYLQADQICNIACRDLQLHYQNEPLQTTKTNVVGAIVMLGLAKRLRARISNFIFQALRGEPITIYRKGDQTRAFCCVNELGEGIISLIKIDGYVSNPINIGNPNEVTKAELADCVVELTGSPVPLEFRPLPQDGIKQRCPDILRTKALLGWRRAVDLYESLKRTIVYFENLLSRQSKVTHPFEQMIVS